jgi:hypothetical protein
MLTGKNFGIVIWGVKNGFEKKIICSSDIPEVMSVVNDEMRLICNATNDRFFRIDRLNSYNVFTLFDPTMKDDFDRPAYIAVSLFTYHQSRFLNDVSSVLTQVMDFYKKAQGNAKVNQTYLEHYEELLKNISVIPLELNGSNFTKNGYYLSKVPNDFSRFLNEPNFNTFKRVYFLNSPNLSIANLPGVEAVEHFSFKKQIKISILNHQSNYTYYVNQQQVTPVNFQRLFQIEVYVGDKVIVKQGHTLVQETVVHLNTTHLQLPKPKPSPPLETSSTTNTPPITEPQRKSYRWVFGLLAIALVAVGLTAYYAFFANQDSVVVDDPTPTITKDTTNGPPAVKKPIIPEGYELKRPEYKGVLTPEGIFSKEQKKIKDRILDGKTFERWDTQKNPKDTLWEAVLPLDQSCLLIKYFKPKPGVKPRKEAGGGKPVGGKNPPPPKTTADCDNLERKLFTLQAELNVENDLTLKSKIEQKIVAVEELCIEKRCNCYY